MLTVPAARTKPPKTSTSSSQFIKLNPEGERPLDVTVSNSRKWFICMRGRSFVPKKLFYFNDFFGAKKVEKHAEKQWVGSSRQRYFCLCNSTSSRRRSELRLLPLFCWLEGKKPKMICDESRSRWVGGRGAGGVGWGCLRSDPLPA